MHIIRVIEYYIHTIYKAVFFRKVDSVAQKIYSICLKNGKYRHAKQEH